MKGIVFAAAVGLTYAASDRAAMVEEVNSKPGVLWTAAINERFGSAPVGISKSLMGVKSEEMERRRKFAEAAKLKGPKPSLKLPENFDSAEHWPQCAKVINDIRDQSNCGCCWAFAAAEAASDRMCIATNASMAYPLSAQDICFCASEDGCGGGSIGAPWGYIFHTGVVSGGQYQGSGPFGAGMCADFSMPHCHHHGPQGDDPFPAEGKPGCPSQKSAQCPSTCGADAKAPHKDFASDKVVFDGGVVSVSGEEDIMEAIYKGGPVETAFGVYSDFENYAGGIYHVVNGGQVGGHAVRIVGWGVEKGQKYWKVANSWNYHWGEKGYFRIKKGTNECGIEDAVTGSPNGAKWHKKGADLSIQI
eukprot:TRINITY_DN1580_c0_g1_i2.p1 TRINITY_DN1580_c0_g1~~TRINITY_DN1580_c0_g1_i2.p1  ORF type:complete len:361 (+),score=103.67 TRINITY_DN1580_c0_g1_i2:87-1169(+)